MKKIAVVLSLLLALCLFSTVLAEDPETLTLILRAGTYAEVLKEAIPAFEEANNCKIEYSEETFDDLHTKIALDAVNAEGAYDVLMLDGTWMTEFTENGVLANLSDMGYKFDDDIIPATTAAGVDADGNIYMLPYYGNVTIFMYNKDLIDKYNEGNVPATWSGVLELAQKMKADGVDGYILRQGAGDPNVTDFLPVLKAFGGWVLNDDFSAVTLNTPEAKAALEFYIDLYKAGNLLDKDNMVAAVNNGSAAMAVGWPGWGAANYTVIPTKVSDDSEEQYTSIYGCWFLGMAENSAKKDLALKFLEYAMDPEVQLATVEDGGVPCRESSLLAESSLAVKPNLAVVYGALSTGTYRPAVGFYTDLVNTFGPYLDSAVMGTMSVDDALAQGQAACEALLP